MNLAVREPSALEDAMHRHEAYHTDFSTALSKLDRGLAALHAAHVCTYANVYEMYDTDPHGQPIAKSFHDRRSSVYQRREK